MSVSQSIVCIQLLQVKLHFEILNRLISTVCDQTKSAHGINIFRILTQLQYYINNNEVKNAVELRNRE